MPNWCQNKVTITGSSKELQKLKNYVKTEAEPFSLNKVIPIPLFDGNKDALTDQIHDWKEENWNTKLDVDSPELVKDDKRKLVYLFSTAYSPCINVLRKLALMFPNLSIKINFMEYLGRIKGTHRFKGEEEKFSYHTNFPSLH